MPLSVDRQSIPARFTQSQRKEIADLLPALRDRLELESKNQRTLPFTIDELSEMARKASDAMPTAPNGMRRNSLRHVRDTAEQAIERCKMREALVAETLVFRFRITLRDIEPAIWRRIEVPDGTLDDLHAHIQTSMGWTNSHLHEFTIRGQRFGDPWLLDDCDGDYPFIDSRYTQLSRLLETVRPPFRFKYEYDFGDGWTHDVVYEGWQAAKTSPVSPRCTGGARSCPPEDVGGCMGYANFLEVIVDPEHEDHEHFVGWSGGNFDPERFRPSIATKAMRNGLFDWRAELIRQHSSHREAV